jgi:hypothetical protein
MGYTGRTIASLVAATIITVPERPTQSTATFGSGTTASSLNSTAAQGRIVADHFPAAHGVISTRITRPSLTSEWRKSAVVMSG